MSENKQAVALGWNDQIKESGQTFIQLVDKKQYLFEVRKVEQVRSNGTDKTPPHIQAKVTLAVYDLDSLQYLRDMFYNLPLLSTLEWKLSEFYEGIGLKQKDEPLNMDWNKVLGCKGVFVNEKREYDGKVYDNIKNILTGDKKTQAINNRGKQQTKQSIELKTDDLPF